MPLKLATFNCRGMQDPIKRRKIFHYMRSIDCDIIFLQETHSSVDDEKFWKNQWGELAWFSSHSSNSCGVSILIRNSVAPKFHSLFSDPNGRFIIISVTINGLPLLLVNIYGPNNDNPNFFLDIFSKVDQFSYTSLIVGGDFNAVLGPLDYQGSKNKHSNVKSSQMISTLMDEFNLCDIWRNFHPSLRQYTRHQHNPRVLSRLDYILISEDLINNCVSSKIMPGVQSDHSIVILNFNDGHPPKGRGFWKLNCNYLHYDSDFILLVKKTIQDFKDTHKNSDCNPNIIWDSLKCTIAGVCIEYSVRKKRERNGNKVKLMNEIEKVRIQMNDDPSNESLISQLDNLNADLNKILDFETKGLMIRSRTRWMEEGERSSKYFCNLEKRSCEKKCIYKIKNDNDEDVFTQTDIVKEIHHYFQALYSEKDLNNNFDMNEKFLSDIDIPKLNDDFHQMLDQPFSKKELYDSLVSMKQNKTPGYDGFPVEFYVVFWHDISDLLFNSYKFSIDNGAMSMSQRNGIITLLPKKDKDCLYIKNYRPISLLTVDYKIFAKMLANRLKKCIQKLIHPDQSGFLKGRNIGSNIRLILDIIDYTDFNEIPGAILLLDIEKAFDSVNHDFLLQVLKHFNFGDQFISWIKTIYSCRKSYVINNGFLTDPIDIAKGIFQGCPVSPYLFLLIIETLAISVRQNKDIKGIPVNGSECKISLLADDSTCFLDGSYDSFNHLFNTLNSFAKSSGCKINLSKSNAVWIGAKKGSQYFPFSDQGLTWKSNQFKALGINFSINTRSLFNLNFKTKLNQIETTLNCWRARNLSLIGKICVIKTLLLPQLLYLFFSVLCIKVPKKFFKDLDKVFYRFIWNGGNDRVKRTYMCNQYEYCGLKMIDPYNFSLAQKMTWVKLLLDNQFESVWKTIELAGMDQQYGDMLWRSYAPECVLNKLHSTMLADTLRTWYIYRERLCKEIYNTSFCDMGNIQCLWFNRNVRSKTKQYLFYEDWFDKGIQDFSDLLNPPLPGSKLFEELVLDFGVSMQDRRKLNFLMKCIPSSWLQDSNSSIVDFF